MVQFCRGIIGGGNYRESQKQGIYNTKLIELQLLITNDLENQQTPSKHCD